MKILRVWLLLLLAVLLPMRGAMGAAMPCAADDFRLPAAQSMASGHGHHHHHPAHAAGADEQAPHGAAHHHHEQGSGDKCNLCSACCSSTLMVTTHAPTFASVDSPAIGFPALHVCAPTFLSDGQERPPRSI